MSRDDKKGKCPGCRRPYCTCGDPDPEAKSCNNCGNCLGTCEYSPEDLKNSEADTSED